MVSSRLNILVVAKYTFVELYKSKILVVVSLLGLMISIVSFIASEFTYSVPSKIALDFSLGTMSLSTVGLSIFMGVNLIAKEIENRTVYVILSRPIGRMAFLLGRVLGLWLMMLVNVAVLASLSVVYFFMLGGEYTPLIAWSVVFIFFEAAIVLIFAIFFSLVSNTVLSVVMTIFLYISCHAIPVAQQLTFTIKRPLLGKLLWLYSVIFPDLSKLNIKDFVLYKKVLPFEYLGETALYASLYCMVGICICAYVFKIKDLN